MNKSYLKKIIIGTANFTQKYGAHPTKINRYEIKKILDLAKKNNLLEIDTAESYLKDKNIFKDVNKKFQFSTKILPDDRWISLEYCQKKIEDHLINFNIDMFKVILFHDTKILFKKNGIKIYRNLEYLKKKKYFSKIGISIYNTDCLNFMTENYDLDVVQCPYNILDKRILLTGWFDRLKKLRIETHVRSIFLQGLLVNRSLYKKKHFKRWQKKISAWFMELQKNKITAIDYCFSDLFSCDFDKVIIGVNNSDNLKELIKFKKINKKIKLDLKIDDLQLIDPRKWK